MSLPYPYATSELHIEQFWLCKAQIVFELGTRT